MEEGDAGANFAISALCWVPRGAFALKPRRTEQPTEEEIKKMMEEEQVVVMNNNMDEKDDIQVEQGDCDEEFDEKKIDEELAEYNFENYDDDKDYNFSKIHK